MTGDMWITLAILAVAIFLFVTEWIRVDVVALGVVVALMLTNILTTSEALAGFSSTAVLTIASLFIVGGAVLQTGLAGLIGRRILAVAGTDERRLIIVIMIAVALLSGFMSDTGTVAVLLPAIIALARSAKISPGKLLIPLSFGSLLGGAMTLIGTPPNIIVSDILRQENARLIAEGGEAIYRPFEFFDYTPVGIVLLAVGILFMATMGRQLLPDRKTDLEEEDSESTEELIERYHMRENMFYLRIGRTSTLAGQTLSESNLRHRFDVTVIEVLRRGERALAQVGGQRLVIQSDQSDHIYPTADTVLNVDDIIVVKGERDNVQNMASTHQLTLEAPPENSTESLVNRQVGVAEVLLPPRSKMVGKRLAEVNFNKQYNLSVLDIHRPGVDDKDMDMDKVKLSFGDSLLVQGFWQDIHALRRNRRDLVVIGEPGEMVSAANVQKAPIASIVLVGMLVIIILDIIPLAAASMLAALCMVLTGCLTMDEAYDSIDWKSIVLIAGMLPMATALESVGLVTEVADWTTVTLGGAGPHVVLAGLFILTSVFTQVLSNTATAVLVAPIALAIAQQLDVSPYAFLMGVAIAASMAFASPVASPVNTLVLGAGNYRFGDYIKVGTPLLVIMLIITVITVPIVFPF